MLISNKSKMESTRNNENEKFKEVFDKTFMHLSNLINEINHFINYKKSVFFKNWSSTAKTKKMISKTVAIISNLIEIMRKKTFASLWFSWKSIKSIKTQTKIRQKMLLKKAIENWEQFVTFKENRWIELFYHWRRLPKLEKMYKLKEFKQFFSWSQ